MVANGTAGLTLNRFIEIIGAGEGIRTLDPNLSKVVLRPELRPSCQARLRPATSFRRVAQEWVKQRAFAGRER
jgi:hypothetical protein